MTTPVVLADEPERERLAEASGVVVFRAESRSTGRTTWSVSPVDTPADTSGDAAGDTSGDAAGDTSGNSTGDTAGDAPTRTVLVSEIGQASPTNDTVLSAYRRLSGYPTLAAWRAAIRARNGSLPESGWLYYVALPADSPSVARGNNH